MKKKSCFFKFFERCRYKGCGGADIRGQMSENIPSGQYYKLGVAMQEISGVSKASLIKLKTAIFMFFIVCLIGLCSTSVAGAADTTFRVDSAYGVKTGSTVIIDISVENSHELSGCYFELEYDADIVVATRVIRGELLADCDTFDPDLSNADEGKISILWLNDRADLLSGDGGLFRIYFTVEAKGSTALSVKNLSLFGKGGDTPSIINGYISSSGKSASLEIVTGSYLPGANRNLYYSTSLEASGGIAPYTWLLESGSLPPGLRLSSSGIISGTPTTTGNYSVTIRVTDDDGYVKSKYFTMTVYEAGQSILTIDSKETLPRGRKGASYSFSLKASGGTTPYRWSRVRGSLPPGLRLSSSGVISGTPSSTGSYTFTVRVTDDRYTRQEKEFSLTVTETGHLSADEALFSSFSITRSTMKLNLTPDNMPYTMVVDNDTNWVNLTVVLDDTSDYLRINGPANSSGVSRTVPLVTGINQVTIAVSPDNYLYRNYILTIYRLP